MSSPRSRPRESVGKGGDPRLPSIQPSAGGLDDELTFGDEEHDEYDPRDPWSGEDDRHVPLGERLDIWRRKYLPLPDEVVYEFLGEDEYVVHSDHPSFRAFLTQNVALVVLIPIIGPVFVWLLLREINVTTVTIFLILDLIVAVLAFKRVGDRYTSYVITNLRLIKVTGIFSRNLASIPWTRMTGLGYFQSAWGRLMGYATIFIESANEESGLRNFSDVNDPATFHQRLLDMVSDKSGQSSAHPPAPTRGERRGLLSRRKEKKKTAARQAAVAGTAGPTAGPSPPRPEEPAGGGGNTWGRPKVGGQGPGRPKVRGRTGDPGLGAGGPGGSGGSGGPAQPEGAGGSGGSGGAGGAGPPDPEPGPEPPPAPPSTGPEPGGSDAGGGHAGPGRPAAAGPDAGRRPPQPEQDQPGDTPPEGPPAPAGAAHPEGEPSRRPRLGMWFRWPGAGTDPEGGPEPSAQGGGKPQRRPKPPRRPAQQAPSKAPPRTIVVPKAARQPGEPKRSRRGPPPGWRRRVREIDG